MSVRVRLRPVSGASASLLLALALLQAGLHVDEDSQGLDQVSRCSASTGSSSVRSGPRIR